ncbi:Dual specificity protein phosphatase 23 [Balamuthia mandrillaris]
MWYDEESCEAEVLELQKAEAAKKPKKEEEATHPTHFHPPPPPGDESEGEEADHRQLNLSLLSRDRACGLSLSSPPRGTSFCWLPRPRAITEHQSLKCGGGGTEGEHQLLSLLREEEEQEGKEQLLLANLLLPPPPSLYWAIPGKLLGMGCPTHKQQLRFLQEQCGVRLVVNLQERCPPREWFPPSSFAARPLRSSSSSVAYSGFSSARGEGDSYVPFAEMDYEAIPVRSFGAPSFEQALHFVQLVHRVINHNANNTIPSSQQQKHQYRYNDSSSPSDDQRTEEDNAQAPSSHQQQQQHINTTNDNSDNQRRKEGRGEKRKDGAAAAVAVHCRAGKGRTGTMIACYFIYSEGISAEEAIQRVRSLSPLSIETKGQEAFIASFAQRLPQENTSSTCKRQGEQQTSQHNNVEATACM